MSGVRPQEPRAGGLLDIAPPGLEQVDPRLMPALDVLEPLDLLGQRSPLLLELRPPVGERRDLPVHALDVGLEALPLLVERRDPRHDIREAFVQTLPFALGRRDAAAERLHLGAAPGGLLAHPSPDVLDLAAALLRLAERLLRAIQLVLAGLELGDDASELLLGACHLPIDAVDARGPRRLRGQVLPRVRLALDGRPERLVGVGALGLGSSERLLGVGEPARGGGAIVGRLQHLPVEPVEQLACRPSVPPDPGPIRPCDGRARASTRAGGRRRACARAPRPARSASRASWPSRPVAGAV